MAKSANVREGLIDVAVIGYDGCSAWISAGLIELFAIANVAAAHTSPPSRTPALRCEVVAPFKRAVRAAHGVRLSVSPQRRRYAAMLVPPLWTSSVHAVESRLEELTDYAPFLNAMAKRAEIVASACSGALLLASAGLLTDRRATTCWWLTGVFRRRFPNIELIPDRLVVRDGDRWTAAAGSAYIHLGLALVQRLCGAAVANATARLMLVERRRGSQSPFMSADEQTFSGDELVARAAQQLRAQVAQRVALAEVCERLHVSERTLSRRFQAVMGVSPLTYVQSQRIARARELLERTRLSLEQIVVRCGYEDASSFRKLFARHVGMTPREYRSRFAVRD